MKREKKKKQHYVPRLLLRGFSADTKTVALANLKSGRVISGGAGIREQCCGDYFYGNDLILEDAFAEMEDIVGGILGDLSDKRLESLSKEEEFHLRSFVHLQAARTHAAAAKVNASTDQLAKTYISTLEQVSEEELGDYVIESSNPIQEAIWGSVQQLHAISDLAVKFGSSAESVGALAGA